MRCALQLRVRIDYSGLQIINKPKFSFCKTIHKVGFLGDYPKEDIWLHASVTAEIGDYIKKELLFDIRKGSAVLAEFRADYTGLSEVFYPPNEPNERILIFKARLTTIRAVYINGKLKSNLYKQVAV